MKALPHTFFENACTSLVGYMDIIFKPFEKNVLNQNLFPIQIINTGDETYINNYMENKKYTSTPRIDISVRGITTNSEQSTYGGVHGNLTLKNELGFEERMKAPVKRHSVNITLGVRAKFNNIFEWMKFVDYLLTISYNNLVFDTYYLGSVYPCNITIPTDFDNDVNYELEYNDQERGSTMNVPIMFEVQFPAFDVYKISRNSGEEVFNEGDTMLKLISRMHVAPQSDPNNYTKISTNEITSESVTKID